MNCKLSDLNFVFVGFKFTGLFSDYPKLIPQGLSEIKDKEQQIINRLDKTIILYEPCKGEDHKIGYFYLGWIMTKEQLTLPDEANLIRINGKYATSSGTIDQMEEIYSRINNWIREKEYKPIWPETLYIEIYETPLGPEITLREEVQVYLPIE
ncbi:GyrI-like domain-containing protein [Cohnella lupini]|uniref:Integron-associated effector binding protein n=1 Tax=Cohnella lupini TaxID=1294267 RepID=A0A3D9IWQ2_9BACL|nr:GyrI-like domain-containing protein [Cohnella lupini]RED66135.1 integron-associated effector binding protein [Cohnella lupini]